MKPLHAFISAWLAGLGASCGPAAPSESSKVLTIPEVIARIDALDGQTVTVGGYLGECSGYECGLTVNEADYRQFEDWTKRVRAAAGQGGKKLPGEPPDPPMLGIGSGDNFDFDAKAASFTHGYVLITGTVTNMCRYRGRPACTDRSTDLQPTNIKPWHEPAANEKAS